MCGQRGCPVNDTGDEFGERHGAAALITATSRSCCAMVSRGSLARLVRIRRASASTRESTASGRSHRLRASCAPGFDSDDMRAVYRLIREDAQQITRIDE